MVRHGRDCYMKPLIWRFYGSYRSCLYVRIIIMQWAHLVERTSKVLDIYRLADAYDMPGDSVDGMSCEEVHKGLERAVRRASR